MPLSKFESMLKTNSVYFFDLVEFEEIIVHYLDTGKPHTAINEKSTIDRWVFNINLIPHTTEIPIHQQIRQEIL